MTESTKDNPKFSSSWEHPALRDTQEDGTKIEWYERDLNAEALEVVGQVVDSINQLQQYSQSYPTAKTTVDLVHTLQANQKLLMDQLYKLNPGKRVIEASAEGKVTALAEAKNKPKES